MPLEVQHQQPQPQPILQLLHHRSGAGAGAATTITKSCDGLAQGVATIWNLENLRQALLPQAPLHLLLHLTNPRTSIIHLELEDSSSPLPLGWQRLLNLKTGKISYSKEPAAAIMSRRNGIAPKLDLKLNLSPPRVNPHVQSPSRSATVSPTSPPSSCVSSELNQEETSFSNSPEATSMIVAGCPRCLMYIMLPEKDPRCPKCKSTVLLEVFNESSNTTTTKTQQQNN